MESEKMISIQLSLSSIYSMAEEAEKEDDDDDVEHIEEIVTYGQINYIEEDDMTWPTINVAAGEIQEQVISIFSDNTTETVDTVESLENADSSMRDEVSDMRKSMLDLNEIDRLMLYAEDVEVEDQREEYSLEADTVQMKSNFLREFEFPSIYDIMQNQGSVSGSTLRHKRGTRGKFVDAIDLEEPLVSSSSTTTPSPTMSQSSTMKTAMEADNIVEASTDVSSDDDSFPDLDELRFTVPTLSGIIAADEDIDLILKANAEDNMNEIDEFAKELLDAKRRNEESVAKMAQDFLYELFDSVVDQVTYLENTENAKRNFDKDKMIRMLIDLKYKYLFQRELNSIMHSKMREYYKRTKNSRPFAILAPDESHKLHCKHKEALELLDHWLKVAAETKKRTAYLLSSVLMDLSYIINIVMGTEEHFDNLVLKTLTTNRSETMKHIVERELRYMHQKRCEISDARLFLITRKHTLGRIVDRINKLESINEDISMNDFISNNNQVIALEKKIEERNTELKRMRHEYHVALHQSQHIHEKNLAVSAKLIECHEKLAEKERQQEILIAQIQEAKCLHTDLRKKQSELRYQGGLLCMPSLMLDFDVTVEKINTKRANIIELKNTLMHISQRVLELESQCV